MKEMILSHSQILFELERKKVKNINIRITKDLQVKVSANKYVSKKDIIQIVDNNAQDIENKLELLKNKKEELDNYKIQNKDKIKYLGNFYEIEEVEYVEEAEIINDKLCINLTRDRDVEINNFYKIQSEKIFKESLDRMYTYISEYSVDYPKMDIRYMKSLWGSCHINKGKIVLNRHLIKCEIDLIDYVVLHELIHFKCRYHDSSFYKELESKMPDYRIRIEKLNKDYIQDIY